MGIIKRIKQARARRKIEKARIREAKIGIRKQVVSATLRERRIQAIRIAEAKERIYAKQQIKKAEMRASGKGYRFWTLKPSTPISETILGGMMGQARQPVRRKAQKKRTKRKARRTRAEPQRYDPFGF